MTWRALALLGLSAFLLGCGPSDKEMALERDRAGDAQELRERLLQQGDR